MPVPDHLRAAVRAELDALVRGDRPEHLTWVREYGKDGATLVPQPEEIWEHQQSEVYPSDLGGYMVEVPLWTTEESPSDLTAQIYVDPRGGRPSTTWTSCDVRSARTGAVGSHPGQSGCWRATGPARSCDTCGGHPRLRIGHELSLAMLE